MSFIASRVKVPQIQRQGLNMTKIVDWDLKPHQNLCVKLASFFYSSICMNLKSFLYFEIFCVFYFVIISKTFVYVCSELS